MDIVNTLIISIVEGLTEYLPVSSTAHMIFTFALLHIKEDAFAKVFIIAVQTVSYTHLTLPTSDLV